MMVGRVGTDGLVRGSVLCGARVLKHFVRGSSVLGDRDEHGFMFRLWLWCGKLEANEGDA